MKTLHDVSNSLLHRRELRVSLTGSANPGLAAVQKDVAGHVKVGEDVVVVKRLSNPFGSNEFVADVFVYDSTTSRDKFEPKPKAKKGAA